MSARPSNKSCLLLLRNSRTIGTLHPVATNTRHNQPAFFILEAVMANGMAAILTKYVRAVCALCDDVPMLHISSDEELLRVTGPRIHIILLQASDWFWSPVLP